MTLGYTDIEYLRNPDGSRGRIWNVFTGCRHGKDICPVSDQCWAREQGARRMQAGEAILMESGKWVLVSPIMYREYMRSRFVEAPPGHQPCTDQPLQLVCKAKRCCWHCDRDRCHHFYVFGNASFEFDCQKVLA